MFYDFLHPFIEELKTKASLVECNTLLSNAFHELQKKDMLHQTSDDSFSLYGEEGELMHSKIGCIREAEKKFVIPSNIENIESPYLLDLCSGLGYNAAVAIKYNKNVKIDMVEVFEEVLFVALCIPSIIKEQDVIKQAIFNHFKGKNNKKINIIVKDAREFIKTIENKDYDVVFHDAFSPQTDPTLYTDTFLEKIFHNMKEKSVLISYSSSLPFRAGLLEAGFDVENGPSVGRVRGITLAHKGKEVSLPLMERRLIAETKAGMHYHDPNLNWSKDQIFAEREERIQRNCDVLVSINKIKKIFIKSKKLQKK